MAKVKYFPKNPIIQKGEAALPKFAAIMYDDPDHIVPIHTEARDWFAENFDNVVLVDEGRSYEF